MKVICFINGNLTVDSEVEINLAKRQSSNRGFQNGSTAFLDLSLSIIIKINL